MNERKRAPIPQQSRGGERHTAELMDYFNVLRKRKALVLSILFLTVLTTVFHTFTMKPVYQATARLIIDKESARSPVTGERLQWETYFDQQLTFQTHFKIITSRPVMERVLEKASFPEEPETTRFFLFRWLGTLKKNVKTLVGSVFKKEEAEPSIPAEDEELMQKIEELRGRVDIEEVRDTRLLNIHVEDQDPAWARDLANTIADTYIIYDSNNRLESSRKMLTFLTDQLYGMKKKMEDSELAFLEFKSQEKIFSIEGKQKINEKKIDELSVDTITARSQRLEVEAKIAELKNFIGNSGDGVRNIPTFLNNEIIQGLYGELLSAEVEQRKMAGIYRSKHPEMVKVTSQIAELRRKIRLQLGKTLENLEAERAVLMAREQALKGASDGYEEDAIETNRKEHQYLVLEREVESSRDLYNTLLAKIKEANITEGITKTNLRLIEPATLPMFPVKPRKARNLMLSIVLGLMSGVGFAFFLEYLDRKVHNKDQVERFMGVPVLAEIPEEKTAAPKKPAAARHYKLPKLTDLPANSHFAEAFRTLRINLTYSELNRPRSVYLVTSSGASEGKSTISLNLGLTLAQLHFRTLLIEADMRVPAMERMLNLRNGRGLTDVLVNTFGAEVHSGELGEWTISDLHNLFEIQKKTGVLEYTNGDDMFNVVFHEGRIVDIEWPSRPPEERLGNLLVRSGKITKEQAGIAMSKHKSSGERFGRVLLNLEFISAAELAGPLRLQIGESVRRLHNSNGLRFTFREERRLLSGMTQIGEEHLDEVVHGYAAPLDEDNSYLVKKIREHLVKVSDRGMWILPCGAIPPNPAELLASRRMKVLVEMMRECFDVVILDTPPIATVSDAAVLTPMVDGVIMVVHAGHTHREMLRRAWEQLNAVGAPLLGSVLNRIDFKKDPYYYGRYYSRYNRYYHEGGGDGKS